MKPTPSLLALLGLVAIAGYQNRSKISDMIDDARQSRPGDAGTAQPGFMAGISDMFRAGANGGGTLSAGLGDLVKRFTSGGHDSTAQSWVTAGPNQHLQGDDVASAIGDETLDDLATKTGLSRDELIRRLTAAVPDVVNKLTPDGRLPTEAEAQKLL